MKTAQINKHKHPYPATQPGGLLTRALIRLLCLLLACQPVLAEAAPMLAITGPGVGLNASKLPAPNAPYLLETRSRFINPRAYLGSDYFLNRVGNYRRIGGYRPGEALRRFGDAYVETRRILDQLFELGGRPYLGNATDLRGLTFDMTLTPAQTARLESVSKSGLTERPAEFPAIKCVHI